MSIVGGIATYSCNYGYQLAGKKQRTCQNSFWNGRAPTCVKINGNCSVLCSVLLCHLLQASAVVSEGIEISACLPFPSETKFMIAVMFARPGFISKIKTNKKESQ